MSLDEELRRIDGKKVISLFIDIWGHEKLDPSDISDFIKGEVDTTYENYPAFQAIRICLAGIGTKLMEADMITEEEAANRMLGATMMATTLAAYASAETPDSPEGA